MNPVKEHLAPGVRTLLNPDRAREKQQHVPRRLARFENSRPGRQRNAAAFRNKLGTDFGGKRRQFGKTVSPVHLISAELGRVTFRVSSRILWSATDDESMTQGGGPRLSLLSPHLLAF